MYMYMYNATLKYLKTNVFEDLTTFTILGIGNLWLAAFTASSTADSVTDKARHFDVAYRRREGRLKMQVMQARMFQTAAENARCWLPACSTPTGW